MSDTGRLSRADVARALQFKDWRCEGCGCDMWLREQPWSSSLKYCKLGCRASRSAQSGELTEVIMMLVEQGRYHVDALDVADAWLGWERYGCNTARQHQARAMRLTELKGQLRPKLTEGMTVTEVVEAYTGEAR